MNWRKQKKKLQAKIDDCTFRFSSIERHVGDKSFWDLTALMVTPLQMKNLGQNYVYHDDIHCYLSVPDSVSWKPIKTDGIGRQMLFGNPKPSDETDPFFEFQKMRNIYLWKGPGLFKINTIDLETPILHIFPFVSIEEFNNQDFSEMVMTVTKRTVFPPSNATAKIYWDQELILIGTKPGHVRPEAIAVMKELGIDMPIIGQNTWMSFNINPSISC